VNRRRADVPELRTERLTLRGWRVGDRASFHLVNSDPEVMATLGPLMSRAESDALIERIDAHFAAHGFGLWCVDLDGEAIGYTGFMVPWFRDGVEIGWRIRSDRWGRGFAPEAALACLAYGFDVAGLPEIISFAAVSNTKSTRVMEKIGMRYAPGEDFDHPSVPDGNPLRRHVLYRLTAEQYGDPP
jgi:ribosomal-protein-alanine N-acetyltransferase